VARTGSKHPHRRAAVVRSLRAWFDAGGRHEHAADTAQRVDWLRALPFVAMHVACLGVFWVGTSAVAVWTALALYAVRMFAITAFYHRYFSHRTFEASRAVQFVFALIGATAAQRGPLWWAAHHRNHHRHADTLLDPHSPRVHGFLWSHMGWFLTPHAFHADQERINDFAACSELRWLDRYDVAAPIALACALYLAGVLLHAYMPELGTSGGQMLVWGFFISTTALFHATVTINSLAHRFGTRRYETRDDSRNNGWLALLTFGEGWHNNHHFFPGSARQGFRWWEVDATWYGLRLLALLGVVRGLKPVPEWVLAKGAH
jgi:stearoyl-CoA desaturase (delta-9 desaturase)